MRRLAEEPAPGSVKNPIERRRPTVGARVEMDGVRFRAWAPIHHTVEVVFDNGLRIPLEAEDAGYFSGLVSSARAGSRYRYSLDGGEAFPDPASRFQPEGPHGWSAVVDAAFRWTDGNWRGVALPHQVIYEMHIGTFTRQGTWASALEHLPELASLGVTVLEIMPLAEFPGRFGWGYDGVQLFAPTHLYGHPDDFRRFVDRAHSLGLGVILDVVYNHIGPDGNYIPKFAPQFFSDERKTDWGPAINYDGRDSGPVRDFCVENARYWIEDFHLDGLRLDATQDIHDASEDHILRAMAREVRRCAAPRQVIFVAENEPQDVRLVRPANRGGYGLDALWNDDFHHSATVALTGRNEAYYSDYLGTPQEFVSAAKYGFLYQGQRYKWQKKRRGSAGLDIDPAAMITFIQNHDQIANSAYGERCHVLASPGDLRALTALVLLGPGTPLLFQGQEFASSSPFLFFADHTPDLAAQVLAGRAKFLAQFPSLAMPEVQKRFADPADPRTFERCKLDHSERQAHSQVYDLHRDLLKLRREDPVLGAQQRHGVDGAILSPEAFLLRFFDHEADDGSDVDINNDLLLLVNLGTNLHLDPAPEPLLAPPARSVWKMVWSSEDPKYGGVGTPPLETVEKDTVENWRIPGHAAVLLKPVPAHDPS